MKNRAITKIISCVLCAAISMQVGLALTDERVNAVELVTCEGLYGGIYYRGPVTFTPAEGYKIWCSHLPDAGYQDSVTLDEELVNDQDVYFSLKRNPEDDEEEAETVWLVDFYAVPEIGLIFDNTPPYPYEEFTYISEDPYTIDAAISDGAVNVGEELGFDLKDDNIITSVVVTMNGTAIVNDREVEDSSYGVHFSIPEGVVNHVTVTVIDGAENIFSANFIAIQSLVEFEPKVTVENIYYGDTPVPSLSNVPEDYDGKPTFEYKLSSAADTAYTTGAPTDVGKYSVRATFPATELYAATTCDNTFEILKATPDITIKLPDDKIYAGDEYTIEVETNSDAEPDIRFYKAERGDIVSDTVFFEKPDRPGDYIVYVSVEETASYEAAEKTSDTFTVNPKNVEASVTVDDIYVGDTPYPIVEGYPEIYGGDDYPIKITYQNEDGDAVTTFTEAGTYTVKVYFPAAGAYEETTITKEFEVLDREAVTATVTVDPIYVGGTPDPVIEDYPEFYDGDDFPKTITYKNGDGEVVTKFDKAGTYTVNVYFPEAGPYKETTITKEFEVLEKEAVTATITVDPIYVGGTPDPVVEGYPEIYDTDDYTYTITYLDEDGKVVTEFTKAGTYSVNVYFPETDVDAETTITEYFDVNKYTVTATVSVADIFVGGEVKPVVTIDPEGYNGTVEYAYKSSTDTSYSTTVPTAAGEYTVRATLSETDKYLGTSCTNTFTISKKEVSATVSVADIFVGGEVKPVVTTDPEGYNGTITYAYKLSTADDSAYSATVPSVAGTYTVKATLASTEAFLGTTCTSTFTISKKEVSATVSVADIFVGGEVKPVVTTDPEGYNGTITYVYKLSAADDSAYSATVPSAAGTYTVKATLSSTEAFLGTTCTDTFTISKNAVTATVSVANITVGNKPAPVVTSLSKGTATFEYKLSSEGDTAYSEEVPTAAGEYTVRATIAETATYLSTTCTGTFTISKNELKASVSVADIKVGGTVKPVLTVDAEDYNGEVSYEYKSSTANTFSTEVPTAAGTYTVRATLAATDKYLGTTCTGTFTITKNELKASVSVADITVGGTVKPVLTVDAEDYDGKVTYEYKSSTATAYSTTVPAAAGTYTVRATLAATDKYLGTTCTADFTISKNTLSATVSVADITFGNTPKPVVTTDSADYDGAISYEYKLSTADDSAYSVTVPSDAGTYTVRATLSSTVNYLGTICTADFKIIKKTVTATVSVADITVGNTPKPVVTTESNGKDKAEFYYKLSSADESAYSKTIPTAAGTYTVKAVIPEMDNYFGVTCTGNFTISLNKVKVMELSVPDILYGQTVKTSFKTDSNGEITIKFKAADAADSTYSITPPTKVGKYTAMASVGETNTFEAASITVNFSISYLDAPGTPYIPSGTSGNNGYYTSDVVLNAPAGYLISASEGGPFSASIPYSDSLTNVYLKRTSDNALTAGIAVSKNIKIDKEAPSISSSSGVLSGGAVLYLESLTLTISDANLASLIVNGSTVTLSSSGSTVLTLTRPENGAKKYRIVAEDEAGNITVIEFTLKAEWLEDKVIPEGTPVSLVAGEAYYLDEGTWIVSKVNSDGTITEGTTVFSGNIPFYVAVDGEYIFTRVT